MAEDLTATVEIDLITGARIERKVVKEATAAGVKSGKGFQRGFKRSTRTIRAAVGNIRNQLLALGGLFGAGFVVKGFIDAAVEIERLETSLGVLLKSTAAAKDTLEDLQKFAAQTPFQLEGIAKATNTLLAFGFESETVIDRLKGLGDVAAGANIPLQDLAFIIGQVRSEGKLTGERFRQLGERGVVLNDSLKSIIGPAKDLRKEISEGRVSFQDFERAFGSLSSAGGLFQGALQKQSQTIGGVISTLADNFKLLQVQLGQTFGPAIISTAQKLIPIFQRFATTVAANGPELQRTFKSLADLLVVKPTETLTNAFIGAGSDGLAKISAEIALLTKRLERQQSVASETTGFFGGLLKSFAGTEDSIKSLKKEIEVLTIRQEGLQLSNVKLGDSEDFLTRQLQKQRDVRAKIASDQIKFQRQEASLKALGDVGLTDREKAGASFQQDLALLTKAKETEALTEEMFRQRKFQRELEFKEQLNELDRQDAEKKMQFRQELEQAEIDSEEGLFDSFANIGNRFKGLAKQFKVTSKTIASALVQGIGTGAANAFSSFGAALVTGEDALAAFGKALLAAFGQTLVSLGTGFILQGVAQSLAGFGSGAPLIAAGAALATFGGVLSALGGGGAPAASAPPALGGGGGGGDGGFAGDDQSLTGGEEEVTSQGPSINLTIEGNVLDSTESGLRIVEILNEAFETEGAVVKSAEFI